MGHYHKALIRRWWHTLAGMFSGHLGLDLYSDLGIVCIACTCGRVFWSSVDFRGEDRMKSVTRLESKGELR